MDWLLVSIIAVITIPTRAAVPGWAVLEPTRLPGVAAVAEIEGRGVLG
jgi:hypothetical protein